MVNKIKLLVLPLVASALFFHGASHSIAPTEMNQVMDQANVDQATADQADVNLSDGSTDNWGLYGYGLGYNTYLCDWYPYSAGCSLGYAYPWYSGWGWGGGWWGGRGFGGHHHGGHHRR